MLKINDRILTFVRMTNRKVRMTKECHSGLGPESMTNRISPYIGMIAIAALLALAAVLAKPIYVLPVCAALSALIFLVGNLELGMYLIAFLYPFIYLELVAGEMNVPYVDIMAMFVFIVWSLRELHYFLSKGKLRAKFPGIGLFLLFIIASALSLANVDILSLGIKYVLRPLTFFYLMFVILPFNLIRSKKVLFRALYVLFAVGSAVSLMGIWSLVFSEDPSALRRAVPVSIFGLYPLGYNHNLISEVLVSLMPIGMILAYREKRTKLKQIFALGVFMMIAVNLLTFSRAGWLAMFIELAVFGVVNYKEHFKKDPRIKAALVSLVLIPVIFIGAFSLTSTSKSSNQNRMELTNISWELFKDHPIIGNGAGIFTRQVEQTKSYMVDYGGALDAHGVVQKLLAESGILGLLTFSILLGYVLINIWKGVLRARNKEDRFIVLLLFVSALGSVIFQLFNTTYFISKLWLPLGIALTGANVLSGSIYAEKENQ